MTHDLWATLNAKMVDYLDSVSLKDLVDQQKEKAVEWFEKCKKLVNNPDFSAEIDRYMQSMK